MKLVVGLGNPNNETKNFDNTRHNIGFMAIDNIVSNLATDKDFFIDKDINAMLMFHNKVNGIKVLYMKPLTYMNNSGEAIKKAMEKYKIDIEDVIVLYDEVDIPLASYKIKKVGKTSHNGIKNIIKCLDTDEFARIKLGIDKPDKEIIDYVLEKFPNEDIKKIEEELFPTVNKLIHYFTIGVKPESLINKINENKKGK